jgi:hypothetical protein
MYPKIQLDGVTNQQAIKIHDTSFKFAQIICTQQHGSSIMTVPCQREEICNHSLPNAFFATMLP